MQNLALCQQPSALPDALSIPCSRLLQALMSTLLARYLLAVKSVPPTFQPTDDYPESLFSPVRRYWTALQKRRGPAVVIDLLLTLVILAGAVLAWLRFLKIPPETVLTFGGVGGLALGLASQAIVGDLVSGLLLLITQPFAVGDKIQTGGRKGKVKNIGWSSTVIEVRCAWPVSLPFCLSLTPPSPVCLALPTSCPSHPPFVCLSSLLPSSLHSVGVLARCCPEGSGPPYFGPRRPKAFRSLRFIFIIHLPLKMAALKSNLTWQTQFYLARFVVEKSNWAQFFWAASGMHSEAAQINHLKVRC